MLSLIPHALTPEGSPLVRKLWDSVRGLFHPEPPPPPAEELAELRRRMALPQRHRLLHGYPLARAMAPRPDPSVREDVHFGHGLWAQRGLLVGVLPHPFCNPAVAGCGFCTFPHEQYRSDQATATVARVLDEIDQRLDFQPTLRGRAVDGLYFGGGTANLTPAEPFALLCRKLASSFNLTAAEVTLEGVPAYFVKKNPPLMDVMQEHIAARHFRVSMGIQTFDEEQLRRMGRLAFGTAETFAEVVRAAHARGMTASADLLFNLPGQTLAQMRDDLSRAVDLGLDHLGLYHLVLFRGIGTAWSRDPELLAAVPRNEAAAENWLALREFLLERGFRQTTLTNFEREEFRAKPTRFIYEEKSFAPDRHDMIGFGPSAVSFAADLGFATGMKILNPESASAYASGVERGAGAWDRYFSYGPRDLRVFYLTRRLAALEIDRKVYRGLFGADPLTEFPGEFRALTECGLVEVSGRVVRPTPLGMFYADSIAALLAWRRLVAVRQNGLEANAASYRQREAEEEDAFNNGFGHM